jgi:hypothetical protein
MKILHIVADSISLGYGPYLGQYLRPWCEYSRKSTHLGAVENPEGDNGGDSAMILAYLNRARRQDIRWNILLVNCGLHDIRRYGDRHQVDLMDFERNLQELFDTYLGVADTLVWVRTTPVVDDLHNSLSTEFRRYNADVEAYNAAADRLAGARNLRTIDLYGFCQTLGGREIFCDHVHFTDLARQLQAAFIAGQITAWFG